MPYEELLRQTILPELERGRPNWDRPHTESVVAHLKEIIAHNPDLELDADVLIIAAYAHDWGYAGLFRDGQPVDLKEVKEQKPAHMRIGAEKIAALLTHPTFDFLTEAQKTRIRHLVAVHDKTEELQDADELVLMEADTLGAVDAVRTKPTYSKESDAQYMISARKWRLPFFITDFGKAEFARLAQQRAEYYAAL